MTIAVEEVYKTFSRRRRRDDLHGVVALDGVDLEAEAGELVVVVGPSGSGKSTLLRCIAGLETPDEGRIVIADRDVTALPPGARDIAMVFQDFALYPHLTVRENIAFGLKARRTRRKEAGTKVAGVAEMLALDEVLDRWPHELSGGERQRVALARAIVREPQAFLLDEPLSNLDAELRAYSRVEIRALQRRLGTTTVYVTHDQVEALTMGDRVAVLRDGRIEQIDDPVSLYERPASAFVARFLGSPPMNLFPARLHGSRYGHLTMGVRPESIRLVTPDDASIRGVVRAVEPIGGEGIVHVGVDDEVLLVRLRWNLVPPVDTAVGLVFDDADIHLFESTDGVAVR